jgi:hypothetical protein
MSMLIYAKGYEIYEAAVAGAKLKYNRSTDNHKVYSDALKEHYKELTNSIKDPVTRKRVIKATNGEWYGAYLPLALALIHEHRALEKCEPHPRVFLTTDPGMVFDIPMKSWDRMVQNSQKLVA